MWRLNCITHISIDDEKKLWNVLVDSMIDVMDDIDEI